MYNNLRLTYYTNSYLETLLKKYRHVLRYTPVTYYKWANKDSTIDRNLLKNGNWEPFGAYSGMKWYKILFFPLSLVEQTTRQTLGQDYGTYSMNETYAVMPYINFEPTTYDYVLFSFNGNIDEVLYQVVNVESIYKDTTTNENIFRLKLIATGYSQDNIDNHLLNIYGYDESQDKIYPLPDLEKLVYTYEKINELLPIVNNIIPILHMREL